MSEQPNGRGPGPGEGAGHGADVFDGEIGVRWIWVFAGAIVAISVLAAALMFSVSDRVKAARIAQDPPASPLPEANVPRSRPRAALQRDPVGDMVKFRAEEEKVLGEYGWIDRGAGVARIPVERALEIVAEKGLPGAPAAPAAPAAQAAPAATAEKGAKAATSSPGAVRR